MLDPAIERQKMTKKFFMSIQTGLWIASGCGIDMMPLMIEQMPESKEEREELWFKIKEYELNGRIFAVYNSKEDALSFIKAMKDGGGTVIFEVPNNKIRQ